MPALGPPSQPPAGPFFDPRGPVVKDVLKLTPDREGMDQVPQWSEGQLISDCIVHERAS